jgi:hypothetical protein
MEWQLPEAERSYLRDLARRQAEIATQPLTAWRRQQWCDLNDNRPNSRPPVVIETGTFDRDFFPESVSAAPPPPAGPSRASSCATCATTS